MSFIKTKDGVEIFYKDWGKGQPIVFSHGWPLSADDWDAQMMFFVKQGYRVIAHDRRGHGRSEQVSDGHDMDHYADDLAALTAHLDLTNPIHVGHSAGGGDVAQNIGSLSLDPFLLQAVMLPPARPALLHTRESGQRLRAFSAALATVPVFGDLEDEWAPLDAVDGLPCDVDQPVLRADDRELAAELGHMAILAGLLGRSSERA